MTSRPGTSDANLMASIRTTPENSIGREPGPETTTGGEPAASPREPGPRIIPLRGRGPGPTLSELPPPDAAEALYYEGMAAYQHRHWEEALDRFTRLKEQQPSRPGLDALLDEVRWFLQLQAATPTGGAPGSGDGATVEATWRRATRPGSAGAAARFRTTLYIALGILAVAALLLAVFGDRLPWRGNRTVEELYHRGQARLAVGDYEGAQAAFEKMLEISPADPEARLALDRARRQQALAQGYTAAEAAIGEEDWDRADSELAGVLAIDPTYSDAQARAAFVSQRRRLASLYADGGRLYDLGQWEQALEQFEKVRNDDASYRTETVNEFLFVCYLNAGEALLEIEGGGLDSVKTAVGYFGQALAIHPRNLTAADARRLGELYLDALQALVRNDGEQARTQLAALVGEVPGYAGGQAAKRLYDLTVAAGRDALAAGDIPAARERFWQAQRLPVNNKSAAEQGLALAHAATPTRRPTPPNTPTLTPIPTPWASVLAGAVSVRSGPDSTYPVIGELAQGATVAITGRRDDGTWLRVCCTTDRKAGWVPSPALTVRGPLDQAEVVSLPAATATRTAVRPTRTPSSTPTPATNVCVQGNVRDVASAAPLSGWTVRLMDAAGAQRIWETGASGVYLFNNIAPGPAKVSIDMSAGWLSVSPNPADIIAETASGCTTVDFWVEQERPGLPTPIR